ELADLLFHQVGAIALFLDGLCDMLGSDQLTPGLCRPEACLGDDIGDLLKTGAQLRLVVVQASAVFGDFGDCAAVEVTQTTVSDLPGDERGIPRQMLIGPGDFRIEIRSYTKELGEVLVLKLEKVVDIRRTDQDHLHIKRNRLWSQRGGGNGRKLLADILD